MKSNRPLWRAPALLLTGFLVLGAGASAQEPASLVTSDTAEYCAHLSTRVRSMLRSPHPIEAAALSDAGRRMCDNGQTRGGILRLRRALTLLHGGAD